MGKHYRERLEQEKKEKTKQRLVRGGILAAGIAASSLAIAMCGSDSGESLPKEVSDAQAEFTEKFDCRAESNVEVKIGKFADFQTNSSNIEGIGFAFTADNTITLAPDLYRQDYRPTMLHEMVHACADPTVKPFEPFEIGSGLAATGSQAFEVWFNDSTPEMPNTFGGIEEGFAEWIASDFPGYRQSDTPSYRSVAALTEDLAESSGFTRQEGITMHQSGDLLGYIAALTCVDKNEVTSERTADFVFAFNTAFATGEFIPADTLSEC